MGRGSSKAGGGGGGLNPASIKSTTDFLEAGAVGTPVGDAFVRVGGDMAKEYGVRQAPTLVVVNGGTVEKYAGLSEIKRFLQI